MEMKGEEVVSIIDNLSEKTPTKEEYEDLKIIFSRLTINELDHVAKESKIIDMLINMDLDDETTAEFAYSFASKIFDTIDVKRFVQSNPNIIIDVLKSQNSTFKAFVLEKLKYFASSGDFAIDKSLVLEILNNIFDTEEDVVNKAKGIFYSKPEYLDQVLTHNGCLDLIKNIKESSSKLSLFDFFSELTLKNKKFFSVLSTFLVEAEVVSYLCSSDFLVQLNFIKICQKIANHPEGYEILNQSVFFKAFLDQLMKIEQNNYSTLVKPHFNSILSTLFLREPTRWSTEKLVINYFFNEIVNDSLDAIEAIAFISQDENTFANISNLLHTEWKVFIEKLIELIDAKYTDSERLFRILSFFTHCNAKTDHFHQIKAEFIKKISATGNLMRKIVENTKVPYKEIRLFTLDVLNDLTCNPHTIHLILNNEACLSYLLDNEREYNLEDFKMVATKKKYEIINLVGNAEALNEKWKTQFSVRIEQGMWGKKVIPTQVLTQD